MSKTETENQPKPENPREPYPDEPQVDHFVVARTGSYSSGLKKLHIADESRDDVMPLCYHVTRSTHDDDDGARWMEKSISTRTRSWRKGQWCESCLERYGERVESEVLG